MQLRKAKEEADLDKSRLIERH